MKYFIIAALLATAMAKPSGQRGPGGADGDGPFPCLSAEHKAAGKTCFEKGFAQLNQTGTAASATGNSSFCLPSCVLTEFKALDASNQPIPDALVAVITASNLTDAQKTNATAVLKECLTDVTQNASTLMSQCMGGRGPQGGQGGQAGQQGGRPQGGQQGGRPQGGQQGGRPQGGQRLHPEITMSAECQPAAKGMACLGKALSVNKCGPPCGAGRPGGKPQ